MRADLHTMERIDHYLQGKMSGNERINFENEMATNPELHALVKDQELLIQTVTRKAMMAEIMTVAGVGNIPWYSKPWVLGSSAVIVTASITTAVILGSNSTNESLPVISENSEIVTPIEDTDSLTEETFYYTNLDTIGFNDDRNSHTSQSHSTVKQTNHPSEDFEEVCEGSDNDVSINHSTSKKPIEEDVDKSENKKDQKISKRNRMASYPGGILELKKFVDKYMRYPATAKEKKLSGNVKVFFLVTPEGDKSEIRSECFALRNEEGKPLNSAQFMFNQKVAGLFEREAARIVRIMPDWIPATDKSGNLITTEQMIYFNFSLKDGIVVYWLDDSDKSELLEKENEIK